MAIIASLLASILMLLLAVPAAVAVATPATQASPPAAQATPRGASVLHVRVVNLRDSTGQVICTLFNSPMAFPTDPTRALWQIAVPIKDNAAVCSFGVLAPGKYALVAFHDENSNGKFDRNWLGLPKEGYAFSNNVRPVFSPPSFKAAAFDYGGGDQWLTLVMRY
ncbi:MAG TPA: DUF2141 domain-containing protein [Candidatus Binataceae bacterium]|jgi:uncharacterized protein (DUF2141 family)|nr:DUF2141 domain-containing protein [Candidatus Binataceae bacterium]